VSIEPILTSSQPARALSNGPGPFDRYGRTGLARHGGREARRCRARPACPWRCQHMVTVWLPARAPHTPSVVIAKELLRCDGSFSGIPENEVARHAPSYMLPWVRLSLQFGRASAPITSHQVQTMRGEKATSPRCRLNSAFCHSYARARDNADLRWPERLRPDGRMPPAGNPVLTQALAVGASGQGLRGSPRRTGRPAPPRGCMQSCCGP
jgi:hypothetical protein